MRILLVVFVSLTMSGCLGVILDPLENASDSEKRNWTDSGTNFFVEGIQDLSRLYYSVDRRNYQVHFLEPRKCFGMPVLSLALKSELHFVR